MKLIEINGHGLIEEFLRAGNVVIDLGANKGSFSKQISTLYGCRVYAVEASPITFQETYSSDLVQKFNFAICSREKQIQINISKNSEATSLFILDNCEYEKSVTIQGISLVGFISRFSIQSPVTLKLDVEGAELEILKSTPDEFLRTFSQISVEFHEWLGVGSISEIEAIIEKLKGIGFYHFKLSRTNHGNDLFVNSAHFDRKNYISVRVQMFFQLLYRIPKKIIIRL